MENRLVVLLLAACGGSASPPVLSVGGTYDTQVTLLPGNTCGDVQVQNNLTIVSQSPGSESLQLTHAGASYAGTVDRTGASTVPPVQRAGFTIAIAGQFSRTGFTATVTVDPAGCEYKVGWVGTKAGPPNTFP
jgi:hypothetical protein